MNNKSWNIVFWNRPDVHKNCVWSDGKRYFDGPVKEPDAVWWIEKPKTVSDDEE
jgi:hypothetical protein